ncbi:MAG TPA: VanW family protein [Aeromicrobium sp.]|nr:VanW family protein [Aeromicrobium sp.]
MPDVDETHVAREEPKGGRTVVAAVVVVFLGLFITVGFVLTGLRMPARATVGGIDVGGLDPTVAEAKVAAALGSRSAVPITVVGGGRTFVLAPARTGLGVDVEASVRAAGGFHSLNPLRAIRLVAGEVNAPLVVTADDAKLSAVVDKIATALDHPPVEPLVTFKGTEPVVRKPQSGTVVDRQAAAKAIREAYLVKDRIELPVKAAQPTVGQDALDTAMKRIVEPAVSGPVTVRVADQEISLPVSAYTPALSVRVVGIALRPYLDPQLLAGPLTNATTGLAREAVNATIVIEEGKPVIKPAKPGVGLRPQEMAVKLIPAITQTGAARSVTVDSKVVPPTFTTADAEALNIKEKISEFVTYFPYARYRNINQSRAASLINGTILRPGETFSLNDAVGERSKENGFVKGIVIGEGATFVEQYGGAVSQVATTVYNAAFFAGLEDVEHHPHTFYIGRYPLGREATVWWGKLDLRFKNTLANGVLIRAWVVKGSDTRRGEMHVEMWGTKEWDVSSSISDRYNERDPGKRYNDTDECIEQAPMEGFDIDVTRIFRPVGSSEIEKTDVTHVSYVPSDEILCEAPPTPTPAPVAPQVTYRAAR